MSIDVRMDLWDQPLPADERDALLEQIAGAVARRGLETPAILALELHRPFAFLASQGLIFLGPLLGPLLGIERMQTASRLLREPGAVEELIRRIEDRAAPAAPPTAPSAQGKHG